MCCSAKARASCASHLCCALAGGHVLTCAGVGWCRRPCGLAVAGEPRLSPFFILLSGFVKKGKEEEEINRQLRGEHSTHCLGWQN